MFSASKSFLLMSCNLQKFTLRQAFLSLKSLMSFFSNSFKTWLQGMMAASHQIVFCIERNFLGMFCILRNNLNECCNLMYLASKNRESQKCIILFSMPVAEIRITIFCEPSSLFVIYLFINPFIFLN